MTTNSSDASGTASPSELSEVLERPRRPVNMVAGTIGHFVEWYDWYVYGLLAAVFAPQIFPSHSAFASLIAALLTYAIGFVVRPFSGIIVSPLADRYGRRAVLTLSVSGMALGALIIALTPGYGTIGYAAPILFVVARILQGISAGSEQQSAISFMVEHAPPNRRGLFGSFSNMASGLATLAATGAAAITTSAFSPAELAAWGWRIPFLVGGILGVVGLVLRARADETSEFEASSLVDKKSAPARLLALLREHPKALLQTAALSAPAVAYYTWATFLPTYAQLTSGRDKSSTLVGSVIGLTLLVIIVPICGALSDRLGWRKIFPIVGAVGMIVLFYPLLLLLDRPGFWVYVVVAASGWIVLGIWQAVYPTIQAELFPASVRVSGIGFSHQLVIAVFGGTAPLIAAAFVGAGHPRFVALYMIVVIVVCLAVYFTLPETGSKTLRATVALKDQEVVEGELEEVAARTPTKRSLS
ncbi:MHS family alpha-ketoglutarate permease-like MFS transporter [Amycolatopsis lexingtonensis]|uniref:MHS family alpha-ketoglutarate permease-like MFS transporter n=1 Tax=Amycolatopsis lexingtonensis TaxID=218822 RepID=A0ABR9HSV1_9PSEU|nr:MFS transporter [Amycolatopsis lexingtonensis]MBE1494004.1 MHS family alpha-ketoglutarate permease-like MFS transporter [Amycolatopsis lexingtonensis]